jgi:hypothetical protein
VSQQRVGPINVEIVDYHSEATTARDSAKAAARMGVRSVENK